MAKFIVRKVARKKGVSLKKLARLVKKDYSNVCRDTKEDSNPRLETVAEFASALGVRVRDLIED
jgi:DNA-binding phage protein